LTGPPSNGHSVTELRETSTLKRGCARHVPAEQRGFYAASAFKWLRPRPGLGFQNVVQRHGCKARAPTAEAWAHPGAGSGVLRAVEPGLQLVGRFSLGQLLRSCGFSNWSLSRPAVAVRQAAAPNVPGLL